MSYKLHVKKMLAPILAVSLITAPFTVPGEASAKESNKKPATTEPFIISAPTVHYSKGTKATVTVTPKKGNKGNETVVFQLMNGTKVISQSAVEADIKSAQKFSAYFNSYKSGYWVNVSVVSNYNGHTSDFGKSLAASVSDAPFELRVMETTDIHTNLVSYDYYKDAVSDSVGFSRTASLIKQARKEVKNSVLVDNGDLIQGTPLGTYKAKIAPLKKGEVHPVYKAMNLLDYDVATFGNHEFNYGLSYLDEAINDANFPYVNANVYKKDKDNNPKNDKNKYAPYKIVTKKVKDINGKEKSVKIGYIGFAPPQIMDWDKANLDGKVMTKEIVTTAKKYVPEMKKKGADVIVALTHSGFNGDTKNTEDVIYSLSKVSGIDAITFSHTHKVFPAQDETSLDSLFKDSQGKVLEGVDNKKGTINGVPAVQAGYGGSNLGIIDLDIQNIKGKWKVVNSESSTRAINDKITGKKAAEDAAVVKAVKKEHEGTIKYVNTPIGTTTAPIHSYFALVQDDPSVQVVTSAQKWYVEKYIQSNRPEYKDLPILSVGAPFKAGRNGVEEFTEIKEGGLTIRSAGDLYLYDNTLKAIKIKGSVVKEWLEMSAGKYNTIDPAKSEEQELLNGKFAVYNFDVIDGVTYKIDVTKAPRYDEKGIKVSDSSRIADLKYNGEAVDPNQDFIVVTNNYRASGGGNFPGVKGSEYVVDSADENRQILMDYITQEGEINPTADNNWSIAPISGKVNVTFTSSPKGAEYLKEDSPISYTGKKDDKGFGIYKYNLGKENVKVQLLGINDLHGQLDTTSDFGGIKQGRADYLAAHLKQRKAENPENTLLLSAGDAVGASAPVSSLIQDKPTLQFLNNMKFDVGTVGNHEFDKGVETLMAQINGGKSPTSEVVFDKLNFPYVVANVVYKDTKKPILDPYVIKKVGGVDIGFIGVVTNATPQKVSPDGIKNVEFIEQASAVNKAVSELKGKGVKSIVIISHDPGTEKEGVITGEVADLANAVDDEVDVILAGDNHAKVNNYVDNKLIVQAYSYGTAFEDVDLEIDPSTKDIVKKSAEIVTVTQDGMTPDAGTTKFINDYLDMFPELKAPLGTTDEKILRTNAYTQETGLGNLIADSMKADLNSDFAFMNPGGIRADIPKGEVTFSDLAKIQPFGNVLVKLELTGAEVKTLLQQQWIVEGSPKTLQISGLSYTADFSKPVTERVTLLKKADGTPIKDTETYTVAVNDFMASGGDNYTVLKGKERVFGHADLEAFVNYVKETFKGGKITAGIEGRITNINN
ncbi:bifunctional 2',3'-cyclic-nucleotide 2'-phosphodiesterase/3'-nucleotidase [Peribacillus frigoritolerans]|uniref:bifunctional 2',3'-cyclic-nucleotide 2'-phosphodiesterase/3'-nucleotidase n=1 Tax=Peribacillus frigoritolerans TaxID=450367 RepID=UPI00215B729D|nr:bifunctional 2',3'-cyclic-nucleotide 2'-phosphodiesterase/3'-nucleotidase [Peribacillus frigoritolerans]MCR8868927.1 bifunctional 2',3'-cyclic-nucleotide 2'-phosphodiesterase/3'-nucleotidase [Peribacillus frigoritolerans]